MGKKKIDIQRMGGYDGEADIACFYDAEGRRVGIGIMITDKIDEHTKSQIWREWVKVWREPEG